MRGPLLNFEGGAGVPLLYFEVGPGVPLLNFRGVPGPEVIAPGVLVPLLHHTVKNISANPHNRNHSILRF